MPHADLEVRRAYMREYKRARRKTLKGYEEHKAEEAARYARQSARICDLQKTARTKDPEKFRARERVSHIKKSADPERTAKQRDRRYRRTFGLTATQVDTMIAAQAGCCAICKEAFDKRTKLPHVDHCHATGRIRGMLCMQCNLVSGHLEKAAAEGRLSPMFAYLQRGGPCP
jgi:hypothetical protein